MRDVIAVVVSAFLFGALAQAIFVDIPQWAISIHAQLGAVLIMLLKPRNLK